MTNGDIKRYQEKTFHERVQEAQRKLIVTKCHDILNSVGDRFVCGRCKYLMALPHGIYVCEQMNLSRPDIAQDYCSRGEWNYTEEEIKYLAKRKKALERKKAKEANFGKD